MGAGPTSTRPGGILGHDGRGPAAQDVQRCSTERSEHAVAYWDVSYTFRGVRHRVQMKEAPGTTVTVNSQGEPRG
jgi:uncharacterized protein YcfJ